MPYFFWCEMSNFKVKTKYGNIELGYRLFSKIILDAVSDSGSSLLLSTSKSKLINHSSYKAEIEDNRFFELTLMENSYDLKIFGQIEFGKSISKNTEMVISLLNQRLKDILGIYPRSLSIVITGIISQNKTAKKHLEVKR